MKNILFIISIVFFLSACNDASQKKELSFNQQVEKYIKKFPYQDTYKYMLKYTGGDPARLNNPIEAKAELLKAGEDIVVRSNNDTYYTGGFIYLAEGPVKLSSAFHDPNRFYSFQLMDEKNCNFHNIIRPEGEYYLYYGNKPADLPAEQLIEAPSLIVGVITRVEVKNKYDSADVEMAQKIFYGLDITGPEIKEFPQLDLLSSFDETVANRALQMMDSVFATKPIREIIATADMLPEQISYLEHAAATKNAWGAPVAEHSTYETIFFDENGEELFGYKGIYTLTMEEPEVEAFWSLTVYDTERGGYFHPNDDDRYHINNTTAVRNTDGTITFTFKTSCEDGDINCIPVPEGQFDIALRYYLPGKKLIAGEWTAPNPTLLDNK